MTEKVSCPIWGTPAKIISGRTGDGLYIYSSRAAGNYYIAGSAEAMLEHRDERLKAKLTSWLVEQRWLGTQKPEIFSTTIKEANNRRNLSVPERADRILRYIDNQTTHIGDQVRLSAPDQGTALEYHNTMKIHAVSESTEIGEVSFLLNYLSSRGWLKQSADHWGYVLTVGGYVRLAELKTKHIKSSKAFVAMWFDRSMKDLWEEGIKPGIMDAGYDPIRIDETESIEKIDDAIIAEIRRSRFIVVDFTHGENGARGSVYYEAGFAHGMEIPVIFLCRKDMISEIHFDTRQHKHIEWEKDNPGETQRKTCKSYCCRYWGWALIRTILEFRHPHW